MKKFVFLCAFILALFYVSETFAACPLFSDDAGTVDKGHFEYEFAYEMAKAENKEYTFTNCLTYGMLNFLDIGVEIPSAYISAAEADNEGGLSDILLRTKCNFLNNNGIIDLALRFDFKTDTGNDDKGLGSGDKDYALILIGSKEFEKDALHLNLGYNFVGAADNVFSYSAAFEKFLTEKYIFVCEIGGETDFNGDFDDSSLEGMLGLSYEALDNLTIDLAVAFPFTEASADYKLSTGVTVGF